MLGKVERLEQQQRETAPEAAPELRQRSGNRAVRTTDFFNFLCRGFILLLRGTLASSSGQKQRQDKMPSVPAHLLLQDRAKKGYPTPAEKQGTDSPEKPKGRRGWKDRSDMEKGSLCGKVSPRPGGTGGEWKRETQLLWSSGEGKEVEALTKKQSYRRRCWERKRIRELWEAVGVHGDHPFGLCHYCPHFP